MVRWLHPSMLIRTGMDALVAAVFGARADHRLIEAVVRPQPPYFDYSQESPGEDFWLDYVADTGDGWNSTYAVARLLALPSLEVEDPQGQAHAIERGRILVFGGDQVYPGASRDTYEERLVQPYEEALGRTQHPSPDLFAIPGNHDWYDGLSSFMRLFCANRWLAGRRTRQSRSYFALKLPQGWWLIGTDVQLDSDIDVPQVEYFRQVATHMQPEDRIILCNAEPAWVMAATSKRRRGYLENNLDYLQEKVFGRRISLFLAGDLHHYRRHENPDGKHKIIAGGGGAFLHPTHAPAARRLRDGYVHKKSFPDEKTSRKLARQNLMLIRHSPLFGLMTGALYLLLALATYTEIGSYGLTQLPQVLSAVASSVVTRPWSLTLGLATLGGLVGFADKDFGRWRWLAGGLHGLAHITAAFLVAWGGMYFTANGMGICQEILPGNTILVPGATLCAAGWMHVWGKFFMGAFFTFLGGFLVGPFIMGLYLMVSVNTFKAHSNEAFISLAVADWKNFLRLRIDKDGQLTVFPVGLERVPRKWKETHASPYAPAYEPDDPEATPPRLIEPPIRVMPPRSPGP
ncbi:metallophosphoesterase [Archangium lansingense]|uniref:Metallophosphoesterase n=1 Tax=Archangium lansingense TaxID=2995310 RepID=A0ABT4ALW9_9BACT|nr:metallophosphoesterase [Archangium lansinium]MCY1082696.1 metallophosphoesterase [Archangium lansinium]